MPLTAEKLCRLNSNINSLVCDGGATYDISKGREIRDTVFQAPDLGAEKKVLCGQWVVYDSFFSRFHKLDLLIIERRDKDEQKMEDRVFYFLLLDKDKEPAKLRRLSFKAYSLRIVGCSIVLPRMTTMKRPTTSYNVGAAPILTA
jgi:hypothetical protein